MGAKNGSILAPPGPPLETPPGTPRPGPRVHKKCTFFWVFNNSPSRDSLVAFFGQFGTVWDTPSLGQFERIPGRIGNSPGLVFIGHPCMAMDCNPRAACAMGARSVGEDV